MPYATVTDVQNLAPHLPAFSSTSKPTLGQVQEFLTDVEGRLDASFGNLGYVVPIEGAKSLPLVKDMVAHGALARVMRARAIGTANPGDLAAAKAAQDEFDGRLKALCSPSDPFELPDAPRSTERVIKDGVDKVQSLAQTASSFGADCDAVSIDQRF